MPKAGTKEREGEQRRGEGRRGEEFRGGGEETKGKGKWVGTCEAQDGRLSSKGILLSIRIERATPEVRTTIRFPGHTKYNLPGNFCPDSLLELLQMQPVWWGKSVTCISRTREPTKSSTAFSTERAPPVPSKVQRAWVEHIEAVCKQRSKRSNKSNPRSSKTEKTKPRRRADLQTKQNYVVPGSE